MFNNYLFLSIWLAGLRKVVLKNALSLNSNFGRWHLAHCRSQLGYYDRYCIYVYNIYRYFVFSQAWVYWYRKTLTCKLTPSISMGILIFKGVLRNSIKVEKDLFSIMLESIALDIYLHMSFLHFILCQRFTVKLKIPRFQSNLKS